MPVAYGVEHGNQTLTRNNMLVTGSPRPRRLGILGRGPRQVVIHIIIILGDPGAVSRGDTKITEQQNRCERERAREPPTRMRRLPDQFHNPLERLPLIGRKHFGGQSEASI